ncbi:ArsR/SmtB family transcription factor [Zhihengliuella flava]|uniref:ArsR family transcriptional regulator n=1 Tax=Zhihengliuella flava TaxID=1285193 RepID=A0A931D8V2_9MICC|nr:metalloregulator ArsR/SmtB family transcription factor [Zhihengliuella flava]MBG6084148.1 ArsR family transcriptional regulator [Zhihengliuella flava]
MQHQKVFSALADPTRRRILEELAEGDVAVGDLVERVEASQPTVSKHLRVLRDAALVQTRAEGQRRYYRLQPAGLQQALAWFSPLIEPLATSASEGDGESSEQASAAAPASAPAQEKSALTPGAGEGAGTREFGRTMNATVEQVADRAHHLLGRLPKPKFGRRR